MPSVSKEDYLKAIYHLAKASDDSVNTKEIADQLGIQSSSTTDMIKKLAADKLITYKPYKGVRLTSSGRRIAISIVRKHRLWETFLVDKLEFKWDEVHEIAEQLEHTDSPELINRLDAFLGFPKFDPHGDPIPDEHGKIREVHERRLNTLLPGDQAAIVGVKDHSKAFLTFLEDRKMTLGTVLSVKRVFAYDQSMLVHVNQQEVNLSQAVSKNLIVLLS